MLSVCVCVCVCLVCVTSKAPVVTPFGDTQVTFVHPGATDPAEFGVPKLTHELETIAHDAAAAPLNVPVAVPVAKKLPVTVEIVEPVVGPDCGVIEVTVGTG